MFSHYTYLPEIILKENDIVRHMLKCIFENNAEASLRHVAVHAIAVKDHQILLVKRAPHLTNGEKYAFPGGFVDRDETTSEAALREFQEETGYSGKIIQLFRICDTPNRRGEDRQNIAFDYVVEVGEKISTPDQEATEIRWFDFDALPSPEEFAFDHLEHIQRYKKYMDHSEEMNVPIVG